MRPIIIDTDPGQDDAIALLLALASPELTVLGITAVAGNVPLPKTLANALRIVELARRRDISVFAGSDRPLFSPLVTAEYVHGTTGLDGAGLPEPALAPAGAHAVDFLVRALEEAKEPVTLCPLGPLTNIAAMLHRAPHVAGKIEEIVLMGGSWREGGNVTPAAEFNIYVDPHAASLVFQSGIPLVMMPLDVTHKALVTPARLAAIAAIGTPVGRSAAGMLDYFSRFDRDVIGMEGAPLHDPTVIAYLLAPGLFSGVEAHVAIETDSSLTRGLTLVDTERRRGATPNTRVMTDIDAEGFFALLTSRLASL